MLTVIMLGTSCGTLMATTSCHLLAFASLDGIFDCTGLWFKVINPRLRACAARIIVVVSLFVRVCVLEFVKERK